MAHLKNISDKTVEFLNAPPVLWETRLESLNIGDTNTITVDLSAIIQTAAHLKGYIEGRVMYENRDHAFGVKAANNLLAKVRKVLGYAYPRQDVNF